MRVRNARELGALVRDARRRRGMTQKDVAVAAGVDRSWLARLEAGSENPTLTNLLAVVAALRLEVFVADSEQETQVPNGASGRNVGKPKPTLDDVLARLEQKSKPMAKQ
jgi:transcriptional regulator with XRE-family HTH domain